MGLGMHLRMLALSDVAQEPVPGLQLAGPISARVLSVFVFKYPTENDYRDRAREMRSLSQRSHSAGRLMPWRMSQAESLR